MMISTKINTVTGRADISRNFTLLSEAMSRVGLSIPKHFSNPGISGLNFLNSGIPGLTALKYSI